MFYLWWKLDSWWLIATGLQWLNPSDMPKQCLKTNLSTHGIFLLFVWSFLKNYHCREETQTVRLRLKEKQPRLVNRSSLLYLYDNARVNTTEYSIIKCRLKALCNDKRTMLHNHLAWSLQTTIFQQLK